MKAFVITEQGTVQAVQDGAAETLTSLIVRTQKELAKATEQWSASKVVELWNRLPGVQPVKKFTDRKTALTRIWNALQSLEPAVPAVEPAAATSQAELPAPEADAAGPRPNATVPAPDSVGPEPDLAALEPDGASENLTPNEGATTSPDAPRANKTALVLELLRRPGGVTLDEIRNATGWQAHSVRGFISGTVGKKLGLKVDSSKREDGSRVYSISN